ncbi:type IV pilus modification protein PilV [Xylophilus ampelinus]|uniref:Type IV pilus assembly protein PilV n=1 Tax=Xylophilus ampelinus TaxID=54067 RepID=A0A318SIB8_9BURK|nr:type IV pilus modification protein PilV [Xylophilus ampelinus]MCS4509837.1 type IV pilus modification protein PilV [Xylophilus ampelinus]PYE78610.1 type IV pilus assembly protein PilV [Xylophilus ampelinus]
MLHSPTRRHAAGFSLVEVLISVVILSFGLLGMVGLQATSLQANREARLQASGSELAREMGELMRGNADAFFDPVTKVSLGTSPYYFTASSPTLTAPAPSTCLNVGGTPCVNSTAIANAEITDWLARVKDELPGARVEICLDSTPFSGSGTPVWGCSAANGLPTVKIGWTRNSFKRASVQDSGQSFDFASTPGVVFTVDIGLDK